MSQLMWASRLGFPFADIVDGSLLGEVGLIQGQRRWGNVLVQGAQ